MDDMRSNSRTARALARQAKKLEQQDDSWKIWRNCEVCGMSFCINSQWEDKKPRTPRFMGMAICLGCDPRACDPDYGYPYMSNNIRTGARGKSQYRIALAVYIVRQIAKRDCERSTDCGKCIPCASRKLVKLW